MKKVLISVYLFSLAFIGAEASEQKSYEMPRTRVIPIEDTATGGQYELYIKVPEAYLENKETVYPVIYFTDAVWHIEMLSASTAYLMEDVILVGISWQKDMNEDLKKEFGSHASRYRDYTIRESIDPQIQAKLHLGQASKHLAFIRNDVIKHIDSNFRTDPNNRTYFGYSAGGLFGAYILLAQPDTFRNYILGSPSVQGEIPTLSAFGSNAESARNGLDANVYISYGTLEKELGEHADKLINILKNRNDESLYLKHEVIEGSHQAAFPMTGVRSVTWLSNLTKDEEGRTSHTQGEFPHLEGPYMGQTPPGIMAEPFAPGIISRDGWEAEGVFAPGMDEFYFTTTSGKYIRPTVIGFRQRDNVWNKYIEFSRHGEVTFSPDGMRMHMAKGYKDRVGDGWSERKSLGPMFDRDDWGIMRLSASARGAYVFDDYKSNDVIRISTLEDGKRLAPIQMGPMVNTGKWTAHPFIAPDESYLIWDSERDGGYGDSDLYISFRQKDGSWGSAINMGHKVNSDKWDAYASVTPDGKYILFNRGMDDDNANVDIYWVDAKVIETLRPQS